MERPFLRSFLPTLVLAWAFLSASAPGIVAGDSGELVTAAWSLGPAHPPGYPLYLLLGRLASLLPFGTAAFRLSFLSCMALAASYPLLVLALQRHLERQGAGPERSFIAGTTAVFILTGPGVLAQATSPEVYALYFLLSAILLFLAVLGGPRAFYAVFFAAGLALSHHLLVLLFLPALLFVAWDRPRGGRPLVLGMSFLLLGLSTYLVLPLRAHLHPAANWGDPDNLERFLRLLTRAQYGAGEARGLSFGLENLAYYAGAFLRETWGVGALLVLASFWTKQPKGPWPFVAAVGGGGILLPFLLRVPPDPSHHAVISAFFPPVVLWAAPLMATGAWAFFRSIRVKILRSTLTLALVLLVVTRILSSWTGVQSSGDRTAERMGRNSLLTLPKDAALYSRGDSSSFVLFYLKTVVSLRPDVFVTDRTGGTFGDAYSLMHRMPEDLYAFTTAREKGWERERAFPAAFYTEPAGAPGRVLQPLGLLYLADTEPRTGLEDRLWRSYRDPGTSERDGYFTRAEGGYYHLYRGWWNLRRGRQEAAERDFGRMIGIAGDNSRLLSFLGSLEARQGRTREAEGLYRRILDFAPNDVNASFQLGILAEEGGRRQEAEDRYRACLRWDSGRSDIRNNLAVLEMEQGRRTEAIAELERILREAPGYAEAHKNLGLALWGSDRPRAKALLARYLELAPDASDRAAVFRAIR